MVPEVKEVTDSGLLEKLNGAGSSPAPASHGAVEDPAVLSKLEAAPPVKHSRGYDYGAAVGLGAAKFLSGVATGAKDLISSHFPETATEIQKHIPLGLGGPYSPITRKGIKEWEKDFYAQPRRKGTKFVEDVTQAAVPVSFFGPGKTVVGAMASGGATTALSGVFDPTASDKERYGVASNLERGLVGGLLTGWGKGVGEEAVLSLRKAFSQDTAGIARKMATAFGGIAASPATGFVRSSGEFAAEIASYIPAAKRVTSTIYGIMNPAVTKAGEELATAHALQSGAKTIDGAIKNIEDMGNSISFDLPSGVQKIPLTTAQAAQDTGLAIMEKAQRKRVASSILDFTNQQYKRAAEILAEMTSSDKMLGGRVDMETLGSMIRERAYAEGGVMYKLNDKAAEMYKNLEATVDLKAPVSRVLGSDLSGEMGAGYVPKLVDRRFHILSKEDGLPATEEATELLKVAGASNFTVIRDMVKKQLTDVAGMYPGSSMPVYELNNIAADLDKAAWKESGGQLAKGLKMVADDFKKTYFEVVEKAGGKKAEALARAEYKAKKEAEDKIAAYIGDARDRQYSLARHATKFMKSLKRGATVNPEAFRLFWTDAPDEFRHAVMASYFRDALNQAGSEFKPRVFNGLLENLEPNVAKAFEEFSPGFIKNLKNLSRLTDLRDFVEKTQQKMVTNNPQVLSELAKETSQAVAYKIFGAGAHFFRIFGDKAVEILSSSPLQASLMEQALLNPAFASVLLKRDLTSGLDKKILESGFSNVIQSPAMQRLYQVYGLTLRDIISYQTAGGLQSGQQNGE